MVRPPGTSSEEVGGGSTWPETAHCFTAVCPTDLHTTLFHQWQRYDENGGVQTDRMSYAVSEAGKVSTRVHLRQALPGDWRVDGKPRGPMLGPRLQGGGGGERVLEFVSWSAERILRGALIALYLPCPPPRPYAAFRHRNYTRSWPAPAGPDRRPGPGHRLSVPAHWPTPGPRHGGPGPGPADDRPDPAGQHWPTASTANTAHPQHRRRGADVGGPGPARCPGTAFDDLRAPALNASGITLAGWRGVILPPGAARSLRTPWPGGPASCRSPRWPARPWAA